MKVLVACEESQTVCLAFRKRGVEAYSCDIEPCSGMHPEWHLQCDVSDVLSDDWDLIIAHPPCTHLASSGARHFPKKIADGSQKQAIDFFMIFANHPCKKIAIENPVGIMSNVWRKPDQMIQPWMFGHPTTKKTCLWLKGLAKLVPTDIVQPDKPVAYGTQGKSMQKWMNDAFGLSPKERSKLRSKTFQGIANAMAEQWLV